MSGKINLTDMVLYKSFLETVNLDVDSYAFYTIHILSPTISQHQKQSENNHLNVSVLVACKNGTIVEYKHVSKSWTDLPYLMTSYKIDSNGKALPLEQNFGSYKKNKCISIFSQKNLTIGYKKIKIPHKSELIIVKPKTCKTLQKFYPHLCKDLSSSFMDEEFLQFSFESKVVFISATELILSLFAHKHDSVIKYILSPNALDRLHTSFSHDTNNEYHLELTANVRGSAKDYIFFLLKSNFTRLAFSSIYTHWIKTNHLPAVTPIESPINVYARYIERPEGIMITQILYSDLLANTVDKDILNYSHPREKNEDENLARKQESDPGDPLPQEDLETSDELESSEKTDKQYAPTEIFNDTLEALPDNLRNQWKHTLTIKRKTPGTKRPKKQLISADSSDENKDLSSNDGYTNAGDAVKVENRNDGQEEVIEQHEDVFSTTYTNLFIKEGYSVKTFSGYFKDIKKKNNILKKRVNAYSDPEQKTKRRFYLYRISNENVTLFMIDVEYRHYLAVNGDKKKTRPGILIIDCNISFENFIKEHVEEITKTVVALSGKWGTVENLSYGSMRHTNNTDAIIEKYMSLKSTKDNGE